MTIEEFSNEFDILYNNIMSNQAPGLDEYEKSIFLTKAQLEVIKNYFNPKGNKYQEGYDDSAKRQIDFSSLIRVAKPFRKEVQVDYTKIDDRSVLYSMPKDILFILNEAGIITEGELKKHITIIPIRYDEYARLMSKPFKQPLKNQGWRIFHSQGNDLISEVIVKYGSTLNDYKIRYVKRPQPIILSNLADGQGNITIEGRSTVTECELDPILHPEILQRAVELAKAAYIGDLNSSIELGKRSE